MGRKKSFIDKKRSTTFHVVYKEHEDGDDPFEFVSHDQMRQRADEAESAAGSRHPLASLYGDSSDAPPTEEERQEIISMGLPDDGYNYLQHMRAAGARRQMLIIPAAIPEDEVADEAQKDGRLLACTTWCFCREVSHCIDVWSLMERLQRQCSRQWEVLVSRGSGA